MKLAAQVSELWRDCEAEGSNPTKPEWAVLFAAAQKSDATIDRLRKDVNAYRAAVAQIRELLARGPKYWAHAEEFQAILDKLPKDAP